MYNTDTDYGGYADHWMINDPSGVGSSYVEWHELGHAMLSSKCALRASLLEPEPYSLTHAVLAHLTLTAMEMEQSGTGERRKPS